MTKRKPWFRWLAILFCSLVLAAALIYWMVPIPTLILNKISGQISSHLPEGWSLENWQVSRSYLRQVRKGELPQLDFELTDGTWRVFVTLEPRWNASLAAPSVQTRFTIRAESEKVQASPFSGHAHLDFTKQFREIKSLDLDWDNQNLTLAPFGELKGFSGQVKKALEAPEVSFSLSNIDLAHAEVSLLFNGLSATLNLDLDRPSPYLQSGEILVESLSASKDPSSGQLQKLRLLLASENILDLAIGTAKGSYTMGPKIWQLNSENLKAHGKIEKLEHWHISDARLEIPAVSIKSDDDHEVSLEKIEAKGHGHSEDFQGQLAIGTGGAIWGETFMGFPEKGVSFFLQKKQQNTEARIEGLLGKASASLKCSQSCTLQWTLSSSFDQDVQTYAAIYPDAPPLTLKPGGDWKLSGKVPLDSEYQPRLENLSAKLSLEKASLTNEEKTWALQNIHGNFPIQGVGETHAQLKIDNIQYKNLKTSIHFPDWKFYFHLGNKEFRYWLPATSLGGDLAAVEIGQQELYWKSPKTLKFATSLFAVSKNINPLLEKACLAKADSVPEISWSARYPKITASAKKIETPDGAMSARVFTGTARLTRFRIKGWASAIPETNFDFDIKNFNLEPLGQWLNFGRMEGLFEAFAHDVVFRAKIPTGFRSRVELLPVSKKREIIFSSRAMKNFTQLFTSQDVTQQIPGIVRWFAFGWPSDLIGGFNIKYAGISLFSNDGSILLETLDPKWVLQKERQHYLLYGNRFKIPINAMSYPVVLDAPAMSQFVSHMYYQLVGLQDEETPNDGETDETKDWCKYNLGGSTP